MSRKSTRIYLPLDVSFMDDDKIIRAGEQAGWLYLAMALRCKALGVDGVLSDVQVARLHVDGWKQRLERLIEEKAVIPRKTGYALPAYLKWNESMSEKTERLKRDRDRKTNPSGKTKEGDPDA
jgi:lysozyme family protein